MSEIEDHLSLLSKRETDVYALLFSSLSCEQIARKLFITKGSVKFHLTNIYKKLNVKRRTELIGILLEKQQKGNT